MFASIGAGGEHCASSVSHRACETCQGALQEAIRCLGTQVLLWGSVRCGGRGGLRDDERGELGRFCEVV